jgi:hypothetical protein
LDEELKQAIESVKEQQPVAVNLDWYQDTIKLPEIKEFIRANINSASRSFVAIGYYLKYVRDKQLYKEEGYSGVSEFAKAEFGISAAQASKFMSINDRFSKDGNSPVLMDQYKDFSSSKLSEMLYLTDDQLEQVTVATTNVEIREIKNPVKQVDTFSVPKTEPDSRKPSYLKCAAYDFNKFGKGCTGCFYDKAENNCPYDRTDYFAEIKRNDEQKIRYEVLKEMCNTLCKMRSYSLEKSNYSMEAIKNVSSGDADFSFCFGDDGTGHSKYDAEYRAKTNQYRVKEFDGNGKWTFEAGEIDQQIWNYNGNTWRFKQHESSKTNIVNDQSEIVDNEPEIVNDVDVYPAEEMECSNCNYNIMSREEYFSEHPETTEFPCDNCDSKLNHWMPMIEKLNNISDEVNWLESDLVETVEADIIQTVPEDLPKPVQPELPVLKNNDQRKEWAENYRAWGEWYYDEHIDCHYYKFDFPNGDRLVVEEYRDREYYWSASKKDEKHYHLLQMHKPAYERNKIFEQKYVHQTASMTEIVDYLKDLQKKGA